MQAIPFVGPLIFLALGVYRVYRVARVPGTLDFGKTVGVARLCRMVGMFGLYAGAIVGVLNIFSGPLLRLLVGHHRESGIALYVAGVYSALLGAIGLLALVLFEFSRLQAFEQHARVRAR